MGSWDHYMQWTIHQNAKGKSQAALKRVYAEAIHAVWMERN